jgi:hypothetical protein
MTVLNVRRFADSGVGVVPKRPDGFCGRLGPKRPTGFAVTTCHLSNSAPIETISAHSLLTLTRYDPYGSDKLSRLAPPSELIERHSPCRIRSLAMCRPLGAHFAEAIGCYLTFLLRAPV